MRSFFNQRAGYGFIMPALILLVIFSILPILVAFVISFTDMNLISLGDFSALNFVGLDNYIAVLKDPLFLKSVSNTVVYVVIGVPLVIACSLGTALLINFSQAKIFVAFRLIFYTPSITNVIAVAIIWSYLYNPQFGFFNYLLSFLHIPPIQWLQDPAIAKYSLIILAVWKAIGINMIIFLAALQGIPREYYEASELDGASRWQQLYKITIPLLKFALFFVTVTTLIGWLQFFEEPFIMTEGGPLNSTMSISLYIYNNGFKFSNFGFASAASFILFIAIVVITLIQFRGQAKKDN